MKGINLKIQEITLSLYRKYEKKNTSKTRKKNPQNSVKHTIIRLPQTKDDEKIVKAART